MVRVAAVCFGAAAADATGATKTGEVPAVEARPVGQLRFGLWSAQDSLGSYTTGQ
ncbi:hypothetical protein PGTUg99_026585 [Puccinia graminis f. sp. tritici]|uniref:Uncharacterized protein n=1 Tax=Puccinia graminis f. sp. tritici TaxID=56615 RepID=A0A5B0SFX3_PUCGR|nr:hypothetical protein PGTUg99_026585 [Puccinia graminis f. sp. tritici]